MSALDVVLDTLPDITKDLRLNLQAVLSPDGAPGLSETQRVYVALSTAFATRHPDLMAALTEHAATRLPASAVESAKAAASIMAMNNVYYRFTHVCEDAEVKKLPARLRMNVIGNPGVEKVDFELACLAVSAQNGCTACMNAHVAGARKYAVSAEGIQSAVRIAAVMSGVAQALSLR